MQLINNKLIPSQGMHLVLKSTNQAFESAVYIPQSLTLSDFEEITETEFVNRFCAVRDEIKEQLQILQTQNERLTEIITKIIEAIVPKSLGEMILNLLNEMKG